MKSNESFQTYMVKDDLLHGKVITSYKAYGKKMVIPQKQDSFSLLHHV